MCEMVYILLFNMGVRSGFYSESVSNFFQIFVFLDTHLKNCCYKLIPLYIDCIKVIKLILL